MHPGLSKREIAARKRATRARIFVQHDDGTATCPDCLDRLPPGLDLGSADVDTWEEGSDGWIAAPVCRHCKISLPVVIDGEDPAVRVEIEVYPIGASGFARSSVGGMHDDVERFVRDEIFSRRDVDRVRVHVRHDGRDNDHTIGKGVPKREEKNR